MSSISGSDQFKLLTGTACEGDKTLLPISSRASSYSISSGSFANLKLILEKLVKQQASAKTDLCLAHTKLKKLIGHIHVLEEKLQYASDENIKLKGMGKDDEKLWEELKSKISSRKTSCDQLAETLQHLAPQVHNAEKDKVCFANKLSASSASLDNLHEQMKSQSSKSVSSEEAVTREKELRDLSIEKESVENSLHSELKGAPLLVEEKDAMIKNSEETVATNRLAMESLNSKLEKLDPCMKVKEKLQSLNNLKEELEKEKDYLVSINNALAGNLENALQEIKILENFVNMLTSKLVELESQCMTFSEKVVQLISLFEPSYKLTQDEKYLAAIHGQKKFDKLEHQSMSVTEEKNTLQLVKEEPSNKVIGLQKEQEFAIVQHAKECRLAEENVRRFQSDVEMLQSRKNAMEVLIAKFQEKIRTLSENSRSSDKKMQDFISKNSELEMDHKGQIDELQSDITKKQEDTDMLKKEMENRDQQIDSLEKQVIQLNDKKEKDRHVMKLKGREKKLKDEKAKMEELLNDAETKLSEAKQYAEMLESKQSDLSRHLKENLQLNDQAINDIRRKHNVDKFESATIEKEKADKIIGEMGENCLQKLEKCKEESSQYLLRFQEEHAALISMQQDYYRKELLNICNHSKEIKGVQLEAVNDIRENEQVIQFRALKCEHQDGCRRLQEKLDDQKSEEEKQRAFLREVMDSKPQDDQEVNSEMLDGGDVDQACVDEFPVNAIDEDSPLERALPTTILEEIYINLDGFDRARLQLCSSRMRKNIQDIGYSFSAQIENLKLLHCAGAWHLARSQTHLPSISFADHIRYNMLLVYEGRDYARYIPTLPDLHIPSQYATSTTWWCSMEFGTEGPETITLILTSHNSGNKTWCRCDVDDDMWYRLNIVEEEEEEDFFEEEDMFF